MPSLALAFVLLAGTLSAQTEDKQPRVNDLVAGRSPSWHVTGPLMAAMAFDSYTTERSLAMDGVQPPGYECCYRVWENNPLPGMKHRAGRYAWGAVEIVAVRELHKRNPKWGKIVAWTATAAHIWFGVQNYRDGSRMRRGEP